MSENENDSEGDSDGKDWEALRKSQVSETPDEDPRGDDGDGDE